MSNYRLIQILKDAEECCRTKIVDDINIALKVAFSNDEAKRMGKILIICLI